MFILSCTSSCIIIYDEPPQRYIFLHHVAIFAHDMPHIGHQELDEKLVELSPTRFRVRFGPFYNHFCCSKVLGIGGC